MYEWKIKMNKKTVVLVASLMIIIATSIVYGSFITVWTAPVNIIIHSPLIKVYWDLQCTNPVTAINFQLQQGSLHTVHLYIKNEGQGTIKLWWSSTLNLLTDKITEYWFINGSTISGGGVLITQYKLAVKVDCPLGSYSWTLNLGAQDF